MKSKSKGLKILIYLIESPNIAPSTVIGNFQSLTKWQNILNKYFVNVSSYKKSSIKHAESSFRYLLLPVYINYFFLNSADEIEKKNFIISLFRLNATGLNSVPTSVFKSLINDVSYQLTELFNLIFPMVFPH